MNELMNVELPKWPQMLVKGSCINPDQAFDIILRTDEFLTSTYKYSGGNNHEFNQWYRDISNLWMYEDDVDVQRELRAKLGFIYTEYVCNEWASCSFIYGGHGWCNSYGHIYYEDNIGKWPKVSEVVNEWTLIAKAFPYLNVVISLMSGERSEENNHALVNIRVKQGRVYLRRPNATIHQYQYSEDHEDFRYNTRDECRLSFDHVSKYAAIVKDTLKSIRG
jgi:hypothetical protein